MRSLHLALLVVLAGCGGVGWWADSKYEAHLKSDREFERTYFEPRRARVREQIKAFQQARQDERDGKPVAAVPFPDLESPPYAEWTARWERRDRYLAIGSRAGLAGLGALLLWGVTWGAVVFGRNWRVAAIDRAPLPGAGERWRRFVQEGMKLEGQCGPEVVEVDPQRQVVVFRHASFITSFVSNPARELVELPVSALLVVTFQHRRRCRGLDVRTTEGKVEIHGLTTRFEELAALLADICEYNRLSAGAYRAARAREPFSGTPWYGWLLFAALLGAIAAVSWWAWNRG